MRLYQIFLCSVLHFEQDQTWPCIKARTEDEVILLGCDADHFVFITFFNHCPFNAFYLFHFVTFWSYLEKTSETTNCIMVS